MDARIRYTKMIIKEKLFEILKEKTIDKITVKELCDSAQINRATFYKYYENAFDLLDKLEMDALDGLQEKIEKLNSMGDERIMQVFRIILEEVKENKDMYVVLFSENGDKLFKERIFDLCYGDNIDTIRRQFPEMDNAKQEWLYFFLAEGCNGVFNRWLVGGMKEDVDEVVAFLGKVISGINSVGNALV